MSRLSPVGGRVCDAQPQEANRDKQDLPNRELPSKLTDFVRIRALTSSFVFHSQPRIFLLNFLPPSSCAKSWILTLRAAGGLLNVSETKERSRTSLKVRLPLLSPPPGRLLHRTWL